MLFLKVLLYQCVWSIAYVLLMLLFGYGLALYAKKVSWPYERGEPFDDLDEWTRDGDS